MEEYTPVIVCRLTWGGVWWRELSRGTWRRRQSSAIPAISRRDWCTLIGQGNSRYCPLIGWDHDMGNLLGFCPIKGWYEHFLNVGVHQSTYRRGRTRDRTSSAASTQAGLSSSLPCQRSPRDFRWAPFLSRYLTRNCNISFYIFKYLL